MSPAGWAAVTGVAVAIISAFFLAFSDLSSEVRAVRGDLSNERLKSAAEVETLRRAILEHRVLEHCTREPGLPYCQPTPITTDARGPR